MIHVIVRATGVQTNAANLLGINRHYPERLEKNFKVLGGIVVHIMQQVSEPIKFKGTFQSSIVSKVDMTAQQVAIGPTAAHTPFIFTGTRPHWVPIKVLKEWAAVKLGDENLAYPVQKSIARYGTSQGWAKKGIPGAWQSQYGVGFDFITQTTRSGRFTTALNATAKRLSTELVAIGTGKT